jgi:hypothetical protein
MDYETALALAQTMGAHAGSMAWVATPCRVAEMRDGWAGAWCVTAVHGSDRRSFVVRSPAEWEALQAAIKQEASDG